MGGTVSRNQSSASAKQSGDLTQTVDMIKALIVCCLVALATGQRRFPKGLKDSRLEKSLLNTFPFNANEGDHAHGDHGDAGHAEHHAGHDDAPRTILNSLVSGQGRQYGVTEDEPEKKCVQKVMMVEETVWEDHETCDHSYDKRCHKSYTTTYTAVQEEECDEVFRKICYIEMVDTATNVTTNVCKKPLVKDCDDDGPQVCRTEYQSECWSKQIPHEVEDDVVNCKTVDDVKCMNVTEGYTTTERCENWPRQECEVTKQVTTKYTTMTGCDPQPIQLCGPPGCGWVEGPEECHDETRTVISEKPEEECTIEPQKNCKHVTKLLPQLQEVEECVQVPKEICTRSRTNPKKVKKPVIKNWCYTPSQESGLTKK